MEFNEIRAARPFAASPFHLIYRLWKAWYARKITKRILSRLSPAQLKDIGLTRQDVERYK